MISGVLVVTKPENQDRLRETLDALPWADVHHGDADGRLVITIEAPTTDEAMARLREIQELPSVILAEMAAHYVEDGSES
jgi:nitrate reductase NapD